MNNLILIGLPGCGKSTLGRLTAEALGREWIDLDTEIERTAGCPIPTLFAQEGEDGFRQRETAVCRLAGKKQDCVISCGGGVVTRPQNMDLLGENGLIVFIDRPAERIVGDVDTARRPLLKDDAARIYRLAEQREPLYRRYADVTVRNDGDLSEAVAALARIATLPPLRLAVIGDPIGHSRSPQIHLPTLHKFHPDTTYERIRVEKGGLEAFIAYAKTQLDGFNLTMPHKADILPYLDHVDPLAKAIGAVNSVRVENGVLFGYSTDGGFYDALAEEGVSLAGKHLVLLGAGGAADTLAVCGASRGIGRLTVVSRRAAQGEALLAKATAVRPALSVRRYDFDHLSEAVAQADVLVNATPLGMHGVEAEWEQLAFLRQLPPDALVCDLIYNPSPTRFLSEAATLGHQTVGGYPMLVWQGVLADEIYLQTPLNRSRQAANVQRSLQPKEC